MSTFHSYTVQIQPDNTWAIVRKDGKLSKGRWNTPAEAGAVLRAHIAKTAKPVATVPKRQYKVIARNGVKVESKPVVDMQSANQVFAHIQGMLESLEETDADQEVVRLNILNEIEGYATHCAVLREMAV